MEIRRGWLAVLAATAALGMLPATVLPAPPKSGPRATPARSGGPQRIQTLDVARRIDVNSINMWVTNFGSFAYDLSTGNAGLEFPKGSGATAVFASGLWLGCTVGGEVRTVVAEYSQEYGPGRITSPTTFDSPSLRQLVTYKVLRFQGATEDTAHVDRSDQELGRDARLDPLAHHSWSEYIKGAAPYGAPTRFYHLNPANPTDSILGPDVLGDQMLWCVYNDLDPDNHTNDAGRSAPLGVEIQQTTFAFNRQGSLGNTLFLKFKIKNKGGNQLDNMFVSLWADPDLGGFTDDLVGCDTTLSLGFVYNATNNDQLYGITPPAVGYDFFQGPKVGSQILGLASFNKYINGTDPASRNETYNYMKGLQPDGRQLIDPTTGNPTKFFHPGDPVTRTGWLDTNPADRRFLLSSGPFSMAPGDSQEVVGAIVIGRGSDRLSSISVLKCFDVTAQDAFDRNFIVPSPPPQPLVDVSVDHESVTLCWGLTDSVAYRQQEPAYQFEGYNVYQGSSQSGPWTRIATFDVVNGVKTIYDTNCDGENVRVAFGSDNGLSQCLHVTQDNIVGGNLRDGTEYFYAVTTYSYAPVPPPNQPKVLENPQKVIRVIPQRPPSGTDPATAFSATDALQKDDTKVPSTLILDPDNGDPSVVTPSLVTGHIYKVAFQPNPLCCVPERIGADTATVRYVWSLYDSTDNNRLILSNQKNQRGDGDYQVVDGLWFRPTAPYFPTLSGVAYGNVANRRALQAGLNWSGNELLFFGGAGLGKDFFPKVEGRPTSSTLDPSTVVSDTVFTTVRVTFSTAATQKAYRFLRYEDDVNGSAPAGGRRYAYAGFVDVPFKVQDRTTGTQLEAAFVERVRTRTDGTILPSANQPASFDSTWSLASTVDSVQASVRAADSLGGHEYIFVIKRAYTGTADPTIATDIGGEGSIYHTPATLPIQYALWAGVRTDDACGGACVLDNGDRLQFNWAVPATDNDVYAVNTGQLVRDDKALAKSKIHNVRVVPNPYYSMSKYELNQFNRIVRFINLPEQCTIRIFNLGGDLVRTLQKTDITTSTVNWDLLTNNRLPVASGIYIFHIDSPGVGSTVGRMVVFMEKERLNNF